MKDKLTKIYTFTIIIIGILNLITGIYFFIQTPLLKLLVKISSFPERPLLLFSAIMIIYTLLKKKPNKIYLILPVINLVIYSVISLTSGNLSIITNFLLYIFYVSFGVYLLEKY